MERGLKRPVRLSIASDGKVGSDYRTRGVRKQETAERVNIVEQLKHTYKSPNCHGYGPRTDSLNAGAMQYNEDPTTTVSACCTSTVAASELE